jgi:hypothetical protein
MPTSVRFIAAAPMAGGALEAPAAGLAAGGAGVSPRGAMPTRVCFIAAAEGEAAFMAPDDGAGRGGLSVAPQTPHVAASVFAGDPQRGQTLMPADYFPWIQNAMG